MRRRDFCKDEVNFDVENSVSRRALLFGGLIGSLAVGSLHAMSRVQRAVKYWRISALVEVGYQEYVGQGFIPTRDPIVGFAQAVSLCDVP